jgi:hypothetical protein
MDWQPDFTPVAMEPAPVDEARDPKTEVGVPITTADLQLQYHLITHVASSPLHLAIKNWYEPTFIRIMGYRLDAEVEVLQKWKAGQSRLSSAIGASALTFEQVSVELALAFRDMFIALAEAREELRTAGKPVKLVSTASVLN